MLHFVSLLLLATMSQVCFDLLKLESSSFTQVVFPESTDQPQLCPENVDDLQGHTSEMDSGILWHTHSVHIGSFQEVLRTSRSMLASSMQSSERNPTIFELHVAVFLGAPQGFLLQLQATATLPAASVVESR